MINIGFIELQYDTIVSSVFPLNCSFVWWVVFYFWSQYNKLYECDKYIIINNLRTNGINADLTDQWIVQWYFDKYYDSYLLL